MTEHLSFIDGLMARIEGPLNLRFIVQPLVALFFGFRDGLRDAREGQSPFFWALISDATHRRAMVENGWKSIGKVFLIAIVLDLIFQYVVLHDIRVIGALLAATILALIPYLLLRGPINRLSQLRRDRRRP